MLKKQIPCNDDYNLTKFLEPYCSRIVAISMFTKKVVAEKEIKLKEFNFKVLHGILPCNVNLKNWKNREKAMTCKKHTIN